MVSPRTILNEEDVFFLELFFRQNRSTKANHYLFIYPSRQLNRFKKVKGVNNLCILNFRENEVETKFVYKNGLITSYNSLLCFLNENNSRYFFISDQPM